MICVCPVAEGIFRGVGGWCAERGGGGGVKPSPAASAWTWGVLLALAGIGTSTVAATKLGPAMHMHVLVGALSFPRC